jgi:hypothetical protein
MPRARASKAADAQSKETTYSGLPKSVKIWSVPQGNPWPAGVNNIVSFGQVGWNYGGFTFQLGGAVYPMRGIYVPEPGLYTVEAQIGDDRATTPQMFLMRNGAWDPAAGCWAVAWSMPAPARGAQMSQSGTVQCNQGDLLQVSALVDAIVNTDYLWFGVTKLGGQY